MEQNCRAKEEGQVQEIFRRKSQQHVVAGGEGGVLNEASVSPLDTYVGNSAIPETVTLGRQTDVKRKTMSLALGNVESFVYLLVCDKQPPNLITFNTTTILLLLMIL